jgi:predicted ester cyclase
MADDLKALNRLFIEEVLNKGNVARIDDLIAEDVVEHHPLPGSSGGRAGAHHDIGILRAAFPDMRMTTEVELEEGDLHAAVQRVTGTHEGEFLGLPATGKHIDVHFIEVSRVRDGQYVEHWGLVDTDTLMAQLGVQPPAAAASA